MASGNEEFYRLQLVVDMEDRLQGTIGKTEKAVNKFQDSLQKTESAAKKLGAQQIAPVIRPRDMSAGVIAGVKRSLDQIKHAEVDITATADLAEIESISNRIEASADAAYTTTTNGATKAAAAGKQAETALKADAAAMKTVAAESKLTGAAFSGMGDSMKQTASTVQGHIKQMSSHFSSLKSNITGLMGAAAGGFGMFKIAEAAINAGDATYKMATKMHVTAGEAGALNRVLSMSDVDSTAFTTTITRMDRQIQMAGKNGNKTTEALAEWGVNLKDANGSLLPVTKQFEALAEAYLKAEEAGKDQEFAVEVLGPRGMELIPALRDYKENVQDAAKVKTIGLDPKAAHAAARELKVLKAEVKQVGLVMSDAFVPVAREIIPDLMTGFASAAEFAKEHKTLVQGAAKAVGSLVVAYAGLKVVGTGFAMAKTLFDASKIVWDIGKGISNIGGKAGGTFGRVAAPLMAIMDVYKLFKAKDGDMAKTAGGIAGHWAGALAGGKLGAMVGTAFGPIGTIVGGIAGSALGYFVGDALGEKIGSWIGSSKDKFISFGISAKDTVVATITWFANLPDNVSASVTAMKNSVTTTASSLYQEAITTVSQTVDETVQYFRELPVRAGAEMMELCNVCDNWGSNTYNSVVNWFTNLPNAISSCFDNAIAKIKSKATNLWDSATSGISFSPNLSLPGHATGGIFDTPHIAAFAERGREAAIPLDEHRDRAIGIWSQVGNILGVSNGFSAPAPAAAGIGGLNVTVDNISVNMNGADEDALAMRIGRQIVSEIKKAYENR